MKNYESPNVVELGTADVLVLGNSGFEDDAPISLVRQEGFAEVDTDE
jgi:hypothetical protein